MSACTLTPSAGASSSSEVSLRSPLTVAPDDGHRADSRRCWRRRLAALLFSVCCVSLGASPAAAAPCPGSCAAELAANPKSVEQYVKKASAALSKCLKGGSPECPTACLLPEYGRFGLSDACGAVLECRLNDLVEASASDAGWDASDHCPDDAGTPCDLHRLKLAGKLAVKVLSAARKGKLAKLAKLSSRCESGVDKREGCGESDAATAACSAGDAVAYGLMESLYAACDGVAFTEQEMSAAVQGAIAELARKGMDVTPDSWTNAADLFALIGQTFVAADCAGRAQAGTAALHGGTTVGALEDGDTVYCGPNSCTKGDAGCVLPDPGACLNTVCSIHDTCYGQVEQSECIRRDCTWSSQTLQCDADFFASAGVCWTLGQCGFTCKAVIAFATALTAINVQAEAGGSPCPREVGECPACPGACQSDCTCPASGTTSTTTTTLPPGCEFACGDGNCITAVTVCNGVADCANGADEDPATCGDTQNCCVATQGCPSETGTSCALTCCCCPLFQACCPDWTQGCCAAG